jgi:hypothetical protein
MNWKIFINDKSKRAFTDLVNTYPDGPENFVLDSHDYEYTDFREHFREIEKSAKEFSTKSKTRQTYLYDLEFALQMYDYLCKMGFGIWEAADNGCWAYISIRILPDIVYRRWNGYNEDRFYKRNMRLWMKALWWYVHITESSENKEFDIDATRELLVDNSQDIIYLLLDHVGDGFRDTFYHMLMKKYSQICKSGKIKGNREDFFRAVMLQHQISSTVVDPILADENIYVESLYNQVVPLYAEK